MSVESYHRDKHFGHFDSLGFPRHELRVSITYQPYWYIKEGSYCLNVKKTHETFTILGNP